MTTPALPDRCPRCSGAIPSDAPGGVCPRCVMALNLASSTEFTGETGAEAGAAFPAAPALDAVVAAFPQLEIEGLIGRGGMGAVFKARQPRLNRFVALKILPETLARQPAFAERFAREGQLLARLAHPNIVAVHDFGQANGFFHLLMEYVDGVNLRQALQAGRFTPAQALAIVPKICEALQYAHDEGVFHRDIKPENILLDQKGRVKLADFGIAKLAGFDPDWTDGPADRIAADASTGAPGAGPTGAAEALTRPAERLGTPRYMAPEQARRSAQVDHRADIYSLGVVFYELLTGELPTSVLVPPSQRSSVDPRVDDVVRRALAAEKGDRYQSAGEFKTQLDAITGTAAAPGNAPPPVLPQPVRRSRRRMVLAVAATLLIVGALVIVPVFIYLLLGIQRQQHAALQARLAEQAESGARRAAEALAREGTTVRPAARQTEMRDQPQDISNTPISLRLVGGVAYKNLALARVESIAGQPLHQITAHFAGPPIPEDRWRAARGAVSGPVLHPAANEADSRTRLAPVDSLQISRDTADGPDRPSATWFEAPGELQLQFALPSNDEAIEASRQMNAALTGNAVVAFGGRRELFRVGGWSGWLEARAYPAPPGFSLRSTRSKSPTYASGEVTNGMEGAVITVPADCDLTIRVSLDRADEIGDHALREMVVASPSNRPRRFWLDWYLLPDPAAITQEPKPDWALQIYDADTTEELVNLRSSDPELRLRWPEGIGWFRAQTTDQQYPLSDKPIDLLGLFGGKAGAAEPMKFWIKVMFTPHERRSAFEPRIQH